jgi:hypothetical protein
MSVQTSRPSDSTETRRGELEFEVNLEQSRKLGRKEKSIPFWSFTLMTLFLLLLLGGFSAWRGSLVLHPGITSEDGAAVAYIIGLLLVLAAVASIAALSKSPGARSIVFLRGGVELRYGFGWSERYMWIDSRRTLHLEDCSANTRAQQWGTAYFLGGTKPWNRVSVIPKSVYDLILERAKADGAEILRVSPGTFKSYNPSITYVRSREVAGG